MSEYQTKVMRPANMKGISAAREALETAIVQAEKQGDSGDITITALVKNGSIMAVRQSTNKTVPLPAPNS